MSLFHQRRVSFHHAGLIPLCAVIDQSPTPEAATPEDLILARAVARLRTGIMAVTIGMSAAAALFVATVWLVIRGGDNVGQHLGLLRYYMPGYTVTWLGAVIGSIYAAIYGALVGGAIAAVYNTVVHTRERRRP
jgi:hypothetical protein